jgi:hypothetical protein
MKTPESPSPDPPAAFALRHDPRPGDLGALVSLHGTAYSREYGFDPTFEAHVAHQLGDFVLSRTDRDRLWVAERDGRIASCVAVVGHSEKDAQLRWSGAQAPRSGPAAIFQLASASLAAEKHSLGHWHA